MEEHHVIEGSEEFQFSTGPDTPEKKPEVLPSGAVAKFNGYGEITIDHCTKSPFGTFVLPDGSVDMFGPACEAINDGEMMVLEHAGNNEYFLTAKGLQTYFPELSNPEALPQSTSQPEFLAMLQKRAIAKERAADRAKNKFDPKEEILVPLESLYQNVLTAYSLKFRVIADSENNGRYIVQLLPARSNRVSDAAETKRRRKTSPVSVDEFKVDPDHLDRDMNKIIMYLGNHYQI